MFVKILDGQSQFVSESLYECLRFRIHDTENNPEYVAIQIEGVCDAIELTKPKASTTVYVQNESGKTIDCYEWSRKRKPRPPVARPPVIGINP